MAIKPNTHSIVDNSHPLAQGLVGCWLFNEGSGTTALDLVTSNYGGTSIQLDNYGLIKPAGTAATVVGTRSMALNGPCTYVFEMTVLASAATNLVAIGSQTASGHSLAIADSTNRSMRFVKDDSTTDTTWISANAIYTVGVPATFAGVYTGSLTGTDFKLYKDGVSQTPASTTNGGTTKTGNGVITIGSTSTSLNVKYKYCLIYNRALSAQEIASLHSDPYQMIKNLDNIKVGGFRR